MPDAQLECDDLPPHQQRIVRRLYDLEQASLSHDRRGTGGFAFGAGMALALLSLFFPAYGETFHPQFIVGAGLVAAIWGGSVWLSDKWKIDARTRETLRLQDDLSRMGLRRVFLSTSVEVMSPEERARFAAHPPPPV